MWRTRRGARKGCSEIERRPASMPSVRDLGEAAIAGALREIEGDTRDDGRANRVRGATRLRSDKAFAPA